MRKAWTNTSFRNKNKNYNFTLSKNNFIVDAISSVVNSDAIIARTIRTEQLLYNDNGFSYNDISLNTLFAQDIYTTNLSADDILTNTVHTTEISSNILNANDISCTNIYAENITVRNTIIDNLDVSNLISQTIIANNITAFQNILSNETTLNDEKQRNDNQDISINNVDVSLVALIELNKVQDNSINELFNIVSSIRATDTIQDNSINKIDASLVSLFEINKVQDISINHLINNSDIPSISTDVLTGPVDTNILVNTAYTILQGDFSGVTITLENGISNNLIKQITNISDSSSITIDGSFVEHGVTTNSRSINYRLKLKWNSSRWDILDDNYFINNSDSSIYTLRDVGINTSNPQYNLDINGGTIRCQTFIQSSDASLKENITTIDNALNNLLLLRGIYFNHINNPNRQIGFIAQEVEDIFPELVSCDSQGIKSLKYQNITAILVEAIKELKYKYNKLLDDYNLLYSKFNV